MKKAKKEKLKDLCEYSKLNYNPFIFTDETIHQYKYGEFDPTHASIRAKAKQDIELSKAREELANSLGVDYKPKLTPIEDILKHLP